MLYRIGNDPDKWMAIEEIYAPKDLDQYDAFNQWQVSALESLDSTKRVIADYVVDVDGNLTSLEVEGLDFPLEVRGAFIDTRPTGRKTLEAFFRQLGDLKTGAHEQKEEVQEIVNNIGAGISVDDPKFEEKLMVWAESKNIPTAPFMETRVISSIEVQRIPDPQGVYQLYEALKRAATTRDRDSLKLARKIMRKYLGDSPVGTFVDITLSSDNESLQVFADAVISLLRGHYVKVMSLYESVMSINDLDETPLSENDGALLATFMARLGFKRMASARSDFMERIQDTLERYLMYHPLRKTTPKVSAPRMVGPMEALVLRNRCVDTVNVAVQAPDMRKVDIANVTKDSGKLPDEVSAALLAGVQRWLPDAEIVLWRDEVFQIAVNGATKWVGTEFEPDQIPKKAQLWVFESGMVPTKDFGLGSMGAKTGEAPFALYLLPVDDVGMLVVVFNTKPDGQWVSSSICCARVQIGAKFKSYDPVTLAVAGDAFLNSKLTAKVPQQLPRTERRRMEKAQKKSKKPDRKLDVPSIQLVILRRRESSKSNGGGGSGGTSTRHVEWKYRWIVGEMTGGFVRNQYYPSTGKHRPIWIDPFEKGPTGKPLLVRPRVNLAIR
jgi:hypothetical protein